MKKLLALLLMLPGIPAAMATLPLTPTADVTQTFTEPAVNATTFNRPAASTQLGFTGGAGAARVVLQPVPNNKAKYFGLNNARVSQFTTEAVDISGVPEFIVSVDVGAYTTSNTGYETADTLTIKVQTSSNGTSWVDAGGSVAAATEFNGESFNAVTGEALFAVIKVSEPGTGYTAISFPASDFPLLRLKSRAFPSSANAKFARLFIAGGNDSASEFLIIDNITFSLPRASMIVTSTITRDNKADDILENDTFQLNAVIQTEFNPNSTGWTSDSTPEGGPYGDIPVVFGPYPVADGEKTITIKDATNPEIFRTITFTPPQGEIRADLIDLERDDRGTLTLMDDSISFKLTMNAYNGATGWTSNIPKPGGAPGEVWGGNYGDLVTVTAEVATLPIPTLILDRANPSVNMSVAASLPSPPAYVLGELITLSAPPALIGTPEMTPSSVLNIANGWTNIVNGELLMSDVGTSAEFIDSNVLNSDTIDLANVGEVKVTAELVVSETSESDNFETEDFFEMSISWETEDGDQGSINMTEPFSIDENDKINGYSDETGPYDSNRLKDEFNRPEPGKTKSELLEHTFQMTATIPADAIYGFISIEGFNDSRNELFKVQNLKFTEVGVVLTDDSDGDGIKDADEELMGTDKNDPKSVLRLVATEANPGQFTFTGAGNRFYKVYVADDTNDAGQFSKWVDAGLPVMQNAGPHTVTVTPEQGKSRRFYRVVVMQTDGPWPSPLPVTP